MIVFIKELGLAVVLQCNAIMMRPVLVIAIHENAANMVVATGGGYRVHHFRWWNITIKQEYIHTLSEND